MSAQKQIEFKVRKGMRSTRSSAKLAVQSESPKVTVKRTRSCRTTKTQENDIPLAVKVHKKRLEDDSKLKSAVIVPISRLEESSKRIPLSPRKDIQNAIKTPTDRYVPRGAIGLLSNNTPAYENKPTPDQNARISPAKIRALTFGSPVKNNVPATPEKHSSPGITKARALAFSPQKRHAFGDICQSPVKSPRKPFGDVLSTPGKSPRKRLLQDENSLSPRKSPRKSLSSSPRKAFGSPLRLVRQEGTCYKQAKQALHTARPNKIVGREKEQDVVDQFLDKHLVGETPGSLYISGAPGTGKTAILSHKLQQVKEECYYTTCYINCMSMKNSQAIYNKILSQVKGKETSLPIKQCVLQLEKSFSSSGPMILLVLDEIDSLDSKSQEVLYTMFEWPSQPKSRLVLIGIANALDLTDRILPRLQARPKCKPELLNFPPYTKDQIVAVLTERLEKIEVGGQRVLEPSAIQFCARKVSAVAGDMRKALDVCRRAVEMVEADIRKQRLLGSPSKSPSKRPCVPKKITVAHILKIVNEVYGTRVAAQPGKQQAMPLQQKLAICTILLMLKSGKGKEVLLGKYHECYSKICAKQNVSKIDQSEFLSMLTLIEARGILSLKRGKDTRNTKVSLKLDERELEAALQDKVLMSNILAGGIPK